MRHPKTFRVALGATVLMFAICCTEVGGQEKPFANSPSEAEYHIGAGDVLQIAVYQHPELSKSVVVGRDGNIHLPSLNAVRVAGMSPLKATERLRHRLERMLPNPQVIVIVQQIHRRPRTPLRPDDPSPRDIPPPHHLDSWMA